MNNASIQCYHNNAAHFDALYKKPDFHKVNTAWLPHVSQISTKTILDVGAGNGRDAIGMERYFEADVTAVDPAEQLRELGKQNTLKTGIEWVSDSLPALASLQGKEKNFDLITVLAVWMHIPTELHSAALLRLFQLCAPAGDVVITAHARAFDDGRENHFPDMQKIMDMARTIGFDAKEIEDPVADTLNRADTQWRTIILTRPAC